MALFPGPSISVTGVIYATATKHYPHCASMTMVQYLRFKCNGDVFVAIIYDMKQTTSQFSMSTCPVRGLTLPADSLTFECEPLPHGV